MMRLGFGNQSKADWNFKKQNMHVPRNNLAAMYMYASCGLYLVGFFCSVLKICCSTHSQQFSGLLTSGFTLGQ